MNLDEKDFNEDDKKMIQLLDSMYTIEMIENSIVVDLDKNYFVFSKEDSVKLTEEHFDTLMLLSERETLHNPVYVDIDSEGRLLID